MRRSYGGAGDKVSREIFVLASNVTQHSDFTNACGPDTQTLAINMCFPIILALSMSSIVENREFLMSYFIFT